MALLNCCKCPFRSVVFVEEAESSYMIHADTANAKNLKKYMFALEERLCYLINVRLFTPFRGKVYIHTRFRQKM